jgi:hypothetical protein
MALKCLKCGSSELVYIKHSHTCVEYYLESIDENGNVFLGEVEADLGEDTGEESEEAEEEIRNAENLQCNACSWVGSARGYLALEAEIRGKA